MTASVITTDQWRYVVQCEFAHLMKHGSDQMVKLFLENVSTTTVNLIKNRLTESDKTFMMCLSDIYL